MVVFNKEVAAMLNDAYEGSDAANRRAVSIQQLGLGGGETVLDIGCGAGHLTVELARAVGIHGHVIGMDPAESMREKALARVAGRNNVRVVDGRADATGLEKQAIDAAIAVQVYSYLSDLMPALIEARRILKPGAPLVICDIHWGGGVWASTDPAQGQRALDFWSSQLQCHTVPERLPSLSKEAGFSQCRVVPVPVVDYQLRPDGLARMLMALIEASAANETESVRLDMASWQQDQLARAKSGLFYFSATNYVTVLR